MSGNKFSTKKDIFEWLQKISKDNSEKEHLLLLNLAWSVSRFESKFEDLTSGYLWLATLSETEALRIFDVVSGLTPSHWGPEQRSAQSLAKKN